MFTVKWLGFCLFVGGVSLQFFSAIFGSSSGFSLISKGFWQTVYEKIKLKYITRVVKTKDFKIWALRWRDKQVYVVIKKEGKRYYVIRHWNFDPNRIHFSYIESPIIIKPYTQIKLTEAFHINVGFSHQLPMNSCPRILNQD